MALNRNDLSPFWNSGGNFSDKIVSSFIEVEMYSFKRLCNDTIRIKDFSFEICKVCGMFFRDSGKLSPFSWVMSESNLPVADARKIC